MAELEVVKAISTAMEALSPLDAQARKHRNAGPSFTLHHVRLQDRSFARQSGLQNRLATYRL